MKLNYCGLMNIQCEYVINSTIDMVMCMERQQGRLEKQLIS